MKALESHPSYPAIGNSDVAPQWFRDAMQQQRADMQQQRADMIRMETIIAKTNNRLGSTNTHPLEPVPPAANLPDNFPTTIGQLRALSGQALSDALNHYELRTDGKVDEKKAQLADYMGAIQAFN
jgi:hypothetical protein